MNEECEKNGKEKEEVVSSLRRAASDKHLMLDSTTHVWR